MFELWVPENSGQCDSPNQPIIGLVDGDCGDYLGDVGWRLFKQDPYMGFIHQNLTFTELAFFSGEYGYKAVILFSGRTIAP